MMSAVPFGKAKQGQLHPADILRPYMNEINDTGLSVQEHRHGDEFHVFKFYPDADKGQSRSMQIFSRRDGLIEIAYQKPENNIDWSQLYGSSNFESYLQFEQDLQKRLNAISGPLKLSTIIEKDRVALSEQLYLQQYETNIEFDETPSEIYAEWKQSRGNRDGVAASGQVIPHLL